MDAKTKNRIIEACRKEDILARFYTIRGKHIVQFYRLFKGGYYDMFNEASGRIVGTKILQLNCNWELNQKFYNKLFNIINQINKEV